MARHRVTLCERLVKEAIREGARWPASATPGRTREEIAAAGAASVIAPNAEAMRAELAKMARE